MNERQTYPNIMIVGGTGRNAGKTEFVCQVINNFSKSLEIIALKVSSIYPGEKFLHGLHMPDLPPGIQIFMETSPNSGKDTSKMLRAGATKAYFLRVQDGSIDEGINVFFKIEDSQSVIICESNSLAKYIKSGLFVLVKSTDNNAFKKRVSELMDFADLVVESDGISFVPSPEVIKCNSKGWFIL